MAANKNALIRYKTIDDCLKNNSRLWTLDDLMDACSRALREFEGREEPVSRRTIQLDIQNMRSEKLGYAAPIEVFKNKFYRYSYPEYSIRNIPVSERDIRVMNDAIQFLKQFRDFSVFREMNGVLRKLEDSVNAQQQKPVIHVEKNEQLKGVELVDPLYDAVLNRKVLKIIYKSFRARESQCHTAHPQLLKEYNNRWFLVAWIESRIMLLALDRIEDVSEDPTTEFIDKNIDGDEYFSEVIGVTVSERDRPRNVIFFVEKSNAPYVKTKPFHHSQEILEEFENGTLFKIRVQLNFELDRLILGFGETIIIHQPRQLKKRIENKLKKALENYAAEV